MTDPKCPIPGYRFAPFSTWLHVKHAAETNVTLFYWAPLDTAPRPVLARHIFKNGKVRFDAGEVVFTADSGHTDRFFRLEKETLPQPESEPNAPVLRLHGKDFTDK